MSYLRPPAAVTNASSRIGYKMANICTAHGHDLIIVAGELSIGEAERVSQAMGAKVEAVPTDLSNELGMAELERAATDRPARLRGSGSPFDPVMSGRRPC